MKITDAQKLHNNQRVILTKDLDWPSGRMSAGEIFPVNDTLKPFIVAHANYFEVKIADTSLVNRKVVRLTRRVMFEAGEDLERALEVAKEIRDQHRKFSYGWQIGNLVARKITRKTHGVSYRDRRVKGFTAA